MDSMIVLSLVVALVFTPLASLEDLDGNTTDSNPVPVFTFNLGSIFPFLGPVDFDPKRDREPLDDTIDPMEHPSNDSDASGGIVSIRIMEVFSLRDPNKQDELDQPMDDLGQPLLQNMFDSILAEIGLLDLSGKNMTSMEVYSALKARWEDGRPVSTLILSNSRIHQMDAGTFAAAESTISTLVMSNTSVNLDALRGLTNLKMLNLSNNALTTFPWYGLMANTLEVLDLSNNKFEEIRPELSMLKSLRELYLANNKIMFVEEAPLSLMPNLETLDLSMNVLLRADFASLINLNRLDVDWNFLRLMGTDCHLPPQPLSLKLASNPWRCDCALLQTRDTNKILDLDLLQCVMYRNVYNYCIGCERSFLPDRDGLRVAALTEDSIGHQGCRDIPELYNYISDEYIKLGDNEPVKLVQDIILFITLFVFFVVCIFVSIKICCPSKTVREGKVWVKAHEIPKWSFEKLGKSQEVPYIKIDKTIRKS